MTRPCCWGRIVLLLSNCFISVDGIMVGKSFPNCGTEFGIV